jgi:hypothetical protein
MSRTHLIPRLGLGTLVSYEFVSTRDRYGNAAEFNTGIGMVVGTYDANGLVNGYNDHYGCDPREAEGSVGYLVLGEGGLSRIHYGHLHTHTLSPVSGSG